MENGGTTNETAKAHKPSLLDKVTSENLRTEKGTVRGLTLINRASGKENGKTTNSCMHEKAQYGETRPSKIRY